MIKTMLKTNIKDIENLTSTLNVFRESKKGETLTCQEVATFIKTLPSMANRPSILVKHHILTKVDRSHYKFCDEPVYFANLKAALEEAYELARAERAKYNKKPKAPKTLEEFLVTNKLSNDDVAKYLVSTGDYQVSKKVVTWEEF